MIFFAKTFGVAETLVTTEGDSVASGDCEVLALGEGVGVGVGVGVGATCTSDNFNVARFNV